MRRRRSKREFPRPRPLFPEWERDLSQPPMKKKDDDSFIPAEITPGMPPSVPKGNQNG